MQYKCRGYYVDVIRQSVCLVVNLITVNNFSILFNFMPVGQGSDSMSFNDSPNTKLTMWLVGTGHLSASWPIGVQLVVFCSSVSVVADAKGIPRFLTAL